MIGSLSRSLGGSSSTGIVTPSGWVRPSDWLTLPTLTNSDQRVVGLFAVYDSDSNYIALSATGNYTVDWGDGTVENFNTNVTAQHSYTYSSISNSTLSLSGFKQVIISITPQISSSLTSVNFQKKHSTYSLNSIQTVNLLDLFVNSPNLNSLTIGSNSSTVNFLLKQLRIGNNVISNLTNLCYGLIFLESLLIDNSSSFTNISSMMFNCCNLKYPPLFNTIKVVTISSLFRSNILNGSGVIVVPAYNLSSCTNFGSAFTSAYNLSRFMATGITRSISFIDCNLSATAINEIFTNLGTASGTQTITVTGNRGAATCNPNIAVAKGWTVVV